MSNTIKHIGASLAIISMLAAWPSAAAQAAAPLLSQGAWKLHSVSSQELVGEDGAAVNAFDGDAGTIWHTEWFEGSLPHQISVDLGANYVLEAFRYLPRPYTGSNWQTNGRIKDYQLFVSVDGVNWGSAVAVGTFANTAEEKEITFPQATGRFVRLVALSEVNGHPRWISIAELNLRGIPLSGNNPPTAVDDAFSVPIDSANNSLAVLANDTDPDLPQDSLVIDSVGASAAGATLSHDGSVVLYTPPAGYSGVDSFIYVLRDGAGATDSAQVTVQVGATPALLPRAGWNVVSVTSEELVGEDGAAENALDGDPSTIWHTEWFEGSLPHELVLDLGARYALDAFRYLPRPYSGSTWQTNGRIKDYEIYVSEDATTWGTPAAAGTLANTAAEKEVVFDSTRIGRYVRLVALSEVNGHPRWISMAEFNLVGLSASGNTPPSAANDTFSVAGDSSQNLLPVLDNDTDPDPGDTLSIASLGVSQQGATLSHDGTQVRYTPRTGFTGVDSFSYVVRDGAGATDSATVTVQVGSAPALLSRAGWSIESVSSEELANEDGAAANAIDGNPATIWHTEWFAGSLPQEIAFNLGATYTLHAFRYLPRPYTGSSWQTNGRIKDFAFYVSDTAGDWGTPVATGSLANTEFEKEVVFASPKSGRYARLVALSEVNGHPRWISMAEFNLLGTPGDGPAEPPTGSTHYWRLDETGGRDFVDQLGGLSGSCSSCPSPAPGIIRGGQDFAAATAGITIPASTSMDWGTEQDFTIEAWIRSSACGAPQAFVGRVGLASGARWSLGCRDGVALFEVDDGIGGDGPSILLGSRVISDGHWHHVAAVRDALSGQLRLYVDGQEDGRLQAQLPSGVPLAGAETTIGFLGDPQDERRYSGKLDEIAIRGEALSVARVDRHFNDAIAGLGLGYDVCPANAVRIMPLGDSNTERTGYRRPLSIAMRSEGYQKDFVGSRSSTCAEPCTYDPDHEGHAGWRPSDIAASLPGWLDRTPPEVILLHIGTNELDVPGVMDILDIVKQHDPLIVVLLARIINRQVYHPETTAFNNEVAALAALRIAAGDRIRILDHESALVYPDDMSDMLHPTSVGFGKMKDVWLRDLRRFVPACSNAAPIFISQPVLRATKGSRYEYDAVASGVPSAGYLLLEGPAGLFIHPDTGRVSWPSPITGTHQVKILAGNALGDVTQTYTLTVN
jgi:hypothetical protein